MAESLLAMRAASGRRISINSARTKRCACCWALILPAAQTASDSLFHLHDEDLPSLQEGNASVPASSLSLLGWPISQTLDGAALSSQNFGANAARLRRNAILYRPLSANKRIGLPGELQTARPKRLRFLL